jgi:hypothetical protein
VLLFEVHSCSEARERLVVSVAPPTKTNMAESAAFREGECVKIISGTYKDQEGNVGKRFHPVVTSGKRKGHRHRYWVYPVLLDGKTKATNKRSYEIVPIVEHQNDTSSAAESVPAASVQPMEVETPTEGEGYVGMLW